MDELAGPGGPPSAFPPARSPGGSDPQVTVSLRCAPSPDCAGLCRAEPRFWGGGVFPAHWVSGERTASGPQLSFGPGRRQPGVLQAEINVWNTWLEGRNAEIALLREKDTWRRGLERAVVRKNLEEKRWMEQKTSWQWDLSG